MVGPVLTLTDGFGGFGGIQPRIHASSRCKFSDAQKRRQRTLGADVAGRASSYPLPLFACLRLMFSPSGSLWGAGLSRPPPHSNSAKHAAITPTQYRRLASRGKW